MPAPTSLATKIQKLREALQDAEQIVIDFETTGVKPQQNLIVGTGVYIPSTHKSYYINTGHMLADDLYPKCQESELADALRHFVTDPSRHLIAHNATFDLRFLYRLGLDVRCRVSCTLIHSHRVDENLRQRGKESTSHYHTPVSYGLKELTTIYFGEKPPSLQDAIGKKNTAEGDPHSVATYCVLDCYNTWRLYQRARELIDGDPKLRELIDEIDDPNMPILARMMAEGILIDAAEAEKQSASYEKAIQACREEIWKTTKLTWALDTPRDMLKVLRHLQVGDDLGYDPFWLPFYEGERDPSVAREILLEVFEETTNPDKKKVVALFIAKTLMEQRLSSFLKPLPMRVKDTGGRLYPDNFTSTLVTTRFSSSPNLQNMPRKMGDEGDVDEDDLWRSVIPEECQDFHVTKNVFIAKAGHTLVAMDLSAAEPRYLALLFQRALSDKEKHLHERKKSLRAWRKQAYPVLLQRMWDTADEYVQQEDNSIVWPEDYAEDPLYQVFKHGIPVNDPYNALLIAMDQEGYEKAQAAGNVDQWLEDERWRGKRAFLALGYGSTAENLYKPLRWTLSRTEQAIKSIEETYATLEPLRELTLREMIQTGEVRTLWGRPRRITGYYQLARPEPVTVGFYRMRPTYTEYQADIIPLGTTRQAVQAFVERCYVVSPDGKTGEVVLQGDPATGELIHKSIGDAFANAEHFNHPPFRNISFSQIKWVRDQHGLTRHLPRQMRAQRQAVNSLCQGTGADHLRWLMNRMESIVCSQPKFRDCNLILTVHDSLIFEVPDEKVDDFVDAGREVMETPPPWADIPMKVGIEVGKKYGEMKKVKKKEPAKIGCLGRLIRPWLWFKY